MNRRVAFLFPGQGSIPDSLPPMSSRTTSHYRSAEAEGLAIQGWIHDGNTARLTMTDAAQPTILIDSLAREDALRANGVTPTATAGHSLGEFAALTVSGVLDPGDALALVIERGRLMSTVPGAMAAIVKLDLATVRALCKDGSEDVVIANHNGERQVVVSGTEPAVERVIAASEARGGRGIRLKVSGPFHSPFMEPARAALAERVARLDLAEPSTPFFSGVSGRREWDVDRIRRLMQDQMTACVRWVDVVEHLVEAGITHAIEVGTGATLTGLGRRITDRIEFITYEEATDGGL